MPTALACVCSRNQGKLSVADTYGFRVAHISQIQKWVISESKCEETRTFLMPWFTSLEFFRQAEGMDREDCKKLQKAIKQLFFLMQGKIAQLLMI